EPDGEKHGVNILGMTPLDYGDVGNDTALTEALESAGIKVNASLFFGVTTDDFARLPNAELNIAVSSAGVLLANKLKRRFGTSFIAAYPMGSAHFNMLTRRIKGADSEISRGEGSGRLVLIGDQVMMNSLREALYLAGCHADITNASFFCWDGKLAADGDFCIESERNLTEKLQSIDADMVICDSLVARLPRIASLPHVELVHPAVSSRLGWKNVMQYMSAEFDAWIAETSARINEILG
ncbi:MAG: hypothetical protein HUJ65_04280, partial [Oscillospiraceae bacterium]|nr:hypothetical protein [Oscillospiraceae bacterium]